MDLNKMQSNLKMSNLYFSKSEFLRGANITSGELSIELDKEVVPIKEHTYNVILTLNIKNEANDIHLNVIAEAVFEYEASDYSLENDIINKNTVAIMYPYIRSQVTLMTSQPNMTPIVLPTANFSDI